MLKLDDITLQNIDSLNKDEVIYLLKSELSVCIDRIGELEARVNSLELHDRIATVAVLG